VPLFVRWPGVIEPGSVINGIVTHHDYLPTSSPPPASRTSRSSCARATRPATRGSAFTWTGSTSCPTSQEKRRGDHATRTSTGARRGAQRRALEGLEDALRRPPRQHRHHDAGRHVVADRCPPAC
jgi:hypothetical protein